jgi:tetraacyldisaccharide 4'-kinase
VVRPSHRLPPSVFLITDFPNDRPLSPAWLTVPPSRLYGALAANYHRRFDPARAYRAPVPVISIGNLTVGGTGKTPCVMALCRLLGEMDPTLTERNAIAVLSRGYGRRSHGLVVVENDSNYLESGDEPLLIKRSLPQVAVIVSANRSLAARHAVEGLGSRLIVLDDGFQHRQVARDLDLVLLDGAHPLGNGHVLPAGPLREYSSALERSSMVVGVGEEVQPAAQLAARFGRPFIQAQARLSLPDGLSTDLSTPVFVLTSIARPERFVNMLLNRGLSVVGCQHFPDHHQFRERELGTVAGRAVRAGAGVILTTAKDAARIDTWRQRTPLQVVGLTLEFAPPGAMRRLLEPVVSQIVKKHAD